MIPVVGECDDSWLSTAAPVQVEAAGRGPGGRRGHGRTGRRGRGGRGHRDGVLRLEGRHRDREPARGGARRRRARAGQLRRRARPALRRRPRRPGAARTRRRRPGPREAASPCWPPTCRSTARSSSASRAAPASGWPAPAPSPITAAARSSSPSASPAAGRAGRARRRPGTRRSALNDVFTAAVEATEAAVLNCLWAAPDVTGREGRTARGLPHERGARAARRAPEHGVLTFGHPSTQLKLTARSRRSASNLS